MTYVNVSAKGGVATLVLCRGKVNALDAPTIDELKDRFRELEADEAVRAVVFSGEGKFFSFGFDIPGFLGHSRPDFSRFLTKFTDLYTYLFTYPKPVIAALNGHTVAGGLMLALACDRRIMTAEKGKVALNELAFGSSVFAGSVEMLRFAVGNRNAEEILYAGAMYLPEEALRLGLVDEVCSGEELLRKAVATARDLGGKSPPAFQSMKRLLRGPVAEGMRRREGASITEFVDIWYSEATWRNLQEIRIH
ncbi:MAG TPA: enoyl-CoA hydratase/isomerase family protein [Terriglobales bacterium]|nr:enoyl-CoA hydratase/isomerase family protein [Terriglobales bacterium]